MGPERIFFAISLCFKYIRAEDQCFFLGKLNEVEFV